MSKGRDTGHVWVCGTCRLMSKDKETMPNACCQNAILCDEGSVELVDGKVVKAWAILRYL